MEDFKLEPQDPKRDEIIKAQQAEMLTQEELIATLETSTDLDEIVELVYESGNQEVISVYNKERLDHLKANNMYEETEYSYANPEGVVREVGINNIDLVKIETVDEKGYLVDANGKTDTLITQIDHKASDQEFIDSVRAKLLAIVSTPSESEQIH